VETLQKEMDEIKQERDKLQADQTNASKLQEQDLKKFE
jgi:hypothetical protein